MVHGAGLASAPHSVEGPIVKAADWKRIRTLFEEALDHERDERAAFLDQRCGTENEIRREVDSLLEEHDRPGTFVGDSPVVRVADLEDASGAEEGTGTLRTGAMSSALKSGDVLGDRYRIEGEVGRGGMGEVYRARDARLGREVALKVMPSLSASDPDRLRRFDLEARAAGALNHPNVLAIHDVGVHLGAPYIVSELLVGETLRDRLGRGPLPPDKAIDYGAQVARGLVAAHEKGIVHRDLKLENLFLTRDGRVKILDFGIAKLMDRSGVEGADSVNSTLVQHTASGAVMGTASYMSPEQALGEAVDHRSDIFSLGVILYELVTGKRAFDRRSRAETMNAIINDEPVPPSEISPKVGPSLERAMLHCLEKDPDERFQTARDLCFALGEVTTGSGTRVVARAAPRARSRWLKFAVAGAAAVLIVAAGFGAYRFIWSGRELKAEPTIRQITFRRGSMPFQCARFAPDGETIVYSAAWDGGPTELYLGRTDSVESRPLGLSPGRLCSVSRSGEIAFIRNSGVSFGTLARVPLTGSAPRELSEDALQADWTPDGKNLAVALGSDARFRIECPIGSVLYTLPQDASTVLALRVSPHADRIAFIEQLSGTDTLSVLDLAGTRTVLTADGLNGQGLAWTPDGEELLFTRRDASTTVVWAVTLAGIQRRVGTFLGDLRLADLSPDGSRMLMIRMSQQLDIATGTDGGVERSLNWLGTSMLAGVSDDGSSILFSETGEAGGRSGSVYFRANDSPPVRLGDGRALGLSPDGKWALAFLKADQQLVLLPTGAGDPRVLDRGPIDKYVTMFLERWFPDGTRVMFAATEPGHELRTYVQRVDGGPPVAVTPDGTQAILISPDCKSFVLDDGRPDSKGYYVFPVDGGAPRAIPGLGYEMNTNIPLHWSADGKSIFVADNWTAAPQRIFRVNLATGARTLVREFMPVDRVGVDRIIPIRFSSDGASYAYSFRRTLSDILLVEGSH